MSLGSLMAGIRYAETGNAEGDYEYSHQMTTRGRPVGAYGMLPANWERMAGIAGLSDGTYEDPAQQDKMAAFMLQRFLERYDGNEELAAVAWFAGPQVADVHAQNGYRGMDALDPESKEYLNKVLAGQRDNPDIPPRGVTPAAPRDQAIAEAPPKHPMQNQMRGMVEAMSRMRAGGDRVDPRTLGGEEPALDAGPASAPEMEQPE